jgi:hypothetical protein
MRLLVTGPRDWADARLVYWALKAVRDRAIEKDDPITALIHGAARGLDSLADAAGRGLGLTPEPYPAKWSQFGRSAGAVRNRQMRDEGKPTLVLAFHWLDIGHLRVLTGSGTADMVRVAESADLPVYLVRTAEDLAWLAST